MGNVRHALGVVLTALIAASVGTGVRAADPPPLCPSPPTCKVCVVEPKPTTRTVYASKVEEYCLPHCSLLELLLGGHCGCDDGSCCELRVRHRLVVKRVPGCETKQCVVREVPVAGAAAPLSAATAPPSQATPGQPGSGRPPRTPSGE
jgi:hypothetical protein